MSSLKSEKFKILVLDGGGIRGVVTAIILQSVQEQVGKPLNQYFDLIAGTSTGSILAAGIALGLEPKKLINIYEKRGQEIFNALWLRKNVMKWFLGSKYSNKGLIKVLREELGEVTLRQVGEISKAQLLILAYDTLYRNTTFFASRCPEENRWFNDMKLWEVCLSSASAPTFFPPYEFQWKDPNSSATDEWKFPHVDGGVSANCPALAALSYATNVKKINISDITMLSIGTGATTKPIEYKEMKNWGTLSWGEHVPDVFMGGQIQIATDLCSEIIQAANPGGYLRLQFLLNERFGERINPLSPRPILPLKEQKNKYINKAINEAMDDTSEDNIKNLREAASKFAKEKSSDIKKFILDQDPNALMSPLVAEGATTY
ncbi:patatin-like phospholipase family protein [Nostoc edaphicum CCNP1411]|uniref:Patatin-like phospholipase family protein n=1 Tax=Nostoc edaphicum CCNP1411 TaxID=1472755 RepID=A0A7D7QBE8_9NOSO|nr:patatin-like phospholipase family protein [Nostoc edaphicum]QMS92055.1 patatin-like phospholipase family protein [Nostoc edaphicum CCNP1411]